MTAVYDTAHRHCTNHREEILRSTKCGCFHCLSIFEPSEIREWIDAGVTALCPRCPVDAVIGDASGFPITEEFLKDMYEYWFAPPAPSPVSLTAHGIEFANELFELPYEGWEQDWDIQLADANRLQEFLDEFRKSYAHFDDEVRFAIASLILASYDEYLQSQPDTGRFFWNQIEDALTPSKIIYQEVLNYWCTWEEDDEENLFAITPLVREFALR